MNTHNNIQRPAMHWLLPVLAAAVLAACGGDSTTAAAPAASAPATVSYGPAGASPVLGAAASYGLFASSAAITLAVDSSVTGDVGLNPAGACTGCVVGTTVLNGVIHNGDQAAIDAQTAFNTAYVDAANRVTNACVLATSDLSQAQADCAGVTSGPVYVPGLYRSANPIGVGTGANITLDAGGNPDAVFIFQTDAALTTGTSSTVTLANGAQAKNVWWMAGSAATLGVSSSFKGTVIANGAAVQVLGGTALEPTVVEGRLFSHAAGATVAAFATVTVPQ